MSIVCLLEAIVGRALKETSVVRLMVWGQNHQLDQIINLLTGFLLQPMLICFLGVRDHDITELDITESDVTIFQEFDITESDITEKGNFYNRIRYNGT